MQKRSKLNVFSLDTLKNTLFHFDCYSEESASLNYIKQLGLKDNLRLKRGFSMETLCPHEYDIPLVRGGHLEGPHVFGFLIHVFPSEIWTQT